METVSCLLCSEYWIKIKVLCSGSFSEILVFTLISDYRFLLLDQLESMQYLPTNFIMLLFLFLSNTPLYKCPLFLYSFFALGMNPMEKGEEELWYL